MFFCGGSLLAEVVEVLALYVPIFLSELLPCCWCVTVKETLLLVVAALILLKIFSGNGWQLYGSGASL